MGDRACLHENYGSDAGCVRSWHIECATVGHRTRCVRSDGGPGGETAVRIEEIRRLVNLDMVVESTLRRVTAGEGDGGIRQEQLHVVVEPGEGVRFRGRERVRRWIVNLCLQAGCAGVFILCGATVDQELTVRKDGSFPLNPRLRHLRSLYPTGGIGRATSGNLGARQA